MCLKHLSNNFMIILILSHASICDNLMLFRVICDCLHSASPITSYFIYFRKSLFRQCLEQLSAFIFVFFAFLSLPHLFSLTIRMVAVVIR